jgi:hypothetical protein
MEILILIFLVPVVFLAGLALCWQLLKHMARMSFHKFLKWLDSLDTP